MNLGTLLNDPQVQDALANFKEAHAHLVTQPFPHPQAPPLKPGHSFLPGAFVIEVMINEDNTEFVCIRATGQDHIPYFPAYYSERQNFYMWYGSSYKPDAVHKFNSAAEQLCYRVGEAFWRQVLDDGTTECAYLGILFNTTKDEVLIGGTRNLRIIEPYVMLSEH